MGVRTAALAGASRDRFCRGELGGPKRQRTNGTPPHALLFTLSLFSACSACRIIRAICHSVCCASLLQLHGEVGNALLGKLLGHFALTFSRLGIGRAAGTRFTCRLNRSALYPGSPGTVFEAFWHPSGVFRPITGAPDRFGGDCF